MIEQFKLYPEFYCAIILGTLGFILGISLMYIKRNKVESGNPIYDEDEVIRGSFWFLAIFFIFTMGFAELGAFIGHFIFR